MDSRSGDLALVLENPNSFANRWGRLRFQDHQIATATSAHNTVAPGMTASRLCSGSSFQTNIAKAIRPMLDIAAPAASAPAACLPRYFPLRPFSRLRSRSCFSTRVLLAARIAGNARNNPPKLGLIRFAIKPAPAVTSPPRANRITYSYHLVRFNPDVLRATIIGQLNASINSIQVTTKPRLQPSIKEVMRAIPKAPKA
jgi:hypothetical protein